MTIDYLQKLRDIPSDGTTNRGISPLRKVCNFEQKNKQMNFGNREINQIHYTL